MAAEKLTEDDKDRLHRILLERTELDPKTGCWVFVGAWNDKDYGVIVFHGRRLLAHRAAAAIWKGFDLDPNICVIHRCNIRSCCNPRHLQLGSRTDNIEFFRNNRGPKLWEKSLSRLQESEASRGW